MVIIPFTTTINSRAYAEDKQIIVQHLKFTTITTTQVRGSHRLHNISIIKTIEVCCANDGQHVNYSN